MKPVHHSHTRCIKSGLAIGLLATAVPALAQDEKQNQVTATPLPIEIESSSSQPPPNDPLQSLTPGEFQGKLVYIAYVPIKDPEPHWQHFFVLRQVGKGLGTIGTVTTHRVRVSERAFAPQFSPDGNSVLFKVGWPYDRYGSYELYLWNLKTNRLQRGPQDALTYRKVAWSPDGNHLAYIRGGDVNGNTRKNDQLELFIYSLQTGKSRIVASGRGVRSFAWTHQGTLLYASLPKMPQPPKAAEGEAQKIDTTRPDIYEVAAKTGEPKLVFQDGYHPAASPDGKWIACFTSTDPTTNETLTTRFHDNLPRQSYLCLFNRAENKRYIMRIERDTFSDLRWTPDSKRLIVVKTVDNGAEAEAHVSKIEVPGFTTNEVAVLQAKDFKELLWSETNPQFQVLSASKDSSTLFVRVSEITGFQGFSTGSSRLQSVDLASGTISTLMSSKSDPTKRFSGLDWFSLGPETPR